MKKTTHILSALAVSAVVAFVDNLEFFIRNIPWTDEVSIGHAIISDALYMGLEQTIQAYLSKVKIF